MSSRRNVSDVYRVIGWLECITTLPNSMINGAVKAVLVDCVDRLELVGASLLAEDVKPHEGTEETEWPEANQ